MIKYPGRFLFRLWQKSVSTFIEAQILEAIEIDYIDGEGVLSPTDDIYHIDKTNSKFPCLSCFGGWRKERAWAWAEQK